MFHCFFKLKVEGLSFFTQTRLFKTNYDFYLVRDEYTHTFFFYFTAQWQIVILSFKVSLSFKVYIIIHLIIISFSSQHYKAFWVNTHSSSHIKHLKTYRQFDIVSSCLFIICMIVVLLYVGSKDKRFIYYFLSLICLPLYNLTYFVCCFI